MRHVLYFTADWCAPCQRTKPVADELKRDGLVDFLYIDADDNGDLCRKFEIKAVPTFILMEDGKEIRRINGAKTKGELEEFINGSD